MSTPNIPVPYFIVNHELKILETSNTAEKEFPVVASFLDLIDPGSKEKVIQLLENDDETSAEVNMETLEDKAVLYELFFKKEQMKYHVVTIKKSNNYYLVQKEINQLREQLELTNSQMTAFPFYEEQRGDSLKSKGTNSSIIHNKLNTIEEVLRIVRPDFIENYKSEYIDLLLEQVNEIKDLID
ncbi:MAG: hypothetical protein LPK26_09300 [Bacillaceae bacterium]|nr:hypothetical protein [Bacillaceae bacterium]